MITVPLTPAQRIGQHVARAMEILPVLSHHMAAAESAMLHNQPEVVNAILAEQGQETTNKQLTAFAILGTAINDVCALTGIAPLVDTRPFVDKLAAHEMALSESGAVVALPPEPTEEEPP